MELKTCISNKQTLESLKDTKIFSSFYEIIILAAAIGFQKENRRKIDKTDKTIEQYLFEGFVGFNSIYFGISLSEEKNSEVLRDGKDAEAIRHKHFEEYANGGLDILNREVLQRPGSTLENLLMFLRKNGCGFDDGGTPESKKFDFSFGLG